MRSIDDFPPVEQADEEGLLAIGGDLSPARLIKAYSEGIFPWYSEETPILWWSPDPRFVLLPENLHISKTNQKIVRQKRFEIRFDCDFRSVITACGKPRIIEGETVSGTWITQEMIEAYCEMFRLGLAHSAEAYCDGELVGGCYGLSLGKCFFGESMFYTAANASHAAFIVLAKWLFGQGFLFIDSQVFTKNMEQLGATDIPRTDYIQMLKQGLKHPTLQGRWRNPETQNSQERIE